MFKDFIIIFIPYYIILVIHVFQYSHFYDLFFSIYQPKLVDFLLKRSYGTITALELVKYLQKMPFQSSHAMKLVKLMDLPELFQHVRTFSKNTKAYYHISKPHQGYDALSFNLDNFQKIETEQNINLVTFHEKKMIKSPTGIDNKISAFFNKYSLSKTKSLDNNDYGIRPGPVDQLEVGFYSTENYNNAVENIDLSIYNKPCIFFEDYSNIYAKLVFHPKHAGLGHGTLINDFAFEELKWFFNCLENNDEMCSHLNNLLESNSNFPLII